MAVKKAVRRRASGLVGLVGAVVLASSLSVPLMSPVAAEPAAGNTFDTVAEMAQVSGASGTLTTLGDEAPGDGGGLTYTVESKIPEGTLGAVSVMLADGQWAVPQGLPVAPTVASDGAAASRPTPLSGANVHAGGPAPYAITSSALVGMVLSGWDYSHTTYVADQNTQVGYRAEIGQDLGGSWKPDDLAGWFNGQGLLWLNSNGALSAGDIVFFSKPLPDGQDDSGSAPAQSTVFGNVYDVGIYMGDGKVARGSSGGVQVQALDAQAAAEVSMVARPQWSAPAGGAAAPDQQKDSGGAGAGTTVAPQATPSASPQAKPQPTPASGAPSANGGSVPDGGSGSGSQSSGEAGKDDHNEVVVGASGSQSSKGRTSAAERSSAKNARERWLPVTGVAIGVLSMAAILLSGGLIVLRLRRG